MPRVPGTRKILSSYVMASVNFYEIPGEQLPGTRKILTPLISGTRGLIFLTRALIVDGNSEVDEGFQKRPRSSRNLHASGTFSIH